MSRTRIQQRGFAAVAAIFLVVLLAALGGFMLTFSNSQQLTSAQDVQGTRAYWAARAGLEWAIAEVADCANKNATCTRSTTTPPPCIAQTPTTCRTSPYALTSTFLGGFTTTVSWLSTSYFEASPAPTTTENRFVFQITSVAASGTVGSVGYIERSVMATMECVRNAPADGLAYTVADPLTYSCG